MAPTLSKPRVHGAAVKSLASGILTGDYAAGEPIPPEPELCATLSISRSALREAVRILVGKGMVAPRPRIGTVVRPRDEWNLLDPELLAWSLELSPLPEFTASLVEARQVIEPAAARLAAARASARDVADIEDAYRQMEQAARDDDVESYIEADIRFHSALLKASHNVVFQQLSMTVGAALSYAFRINAKRGRRPGESLAQHAAVLEHIRLREPEAAEAALAELLEDVAHSLSRNIAPVPQKPSSKRTGSAAGASKRTARAPRERTR